MSNPLLPDIDHVVVLMLENRSFDNLFGGLYPKSDDFNGLDGTESNPDPNNPSVNIKVWQAPVSGQATIMPDPDPGELFKEDMNQQIFGTNSQKKCPIPTMEGFTKNYAKQPGTRVPFSDHSIPADPRNIMQYFQVGNVPVSYSLARKHVVSDVWHASAPVQTICNRTFVHTGTASKIPGKNKSRIDNGDYTGNLKIRKIIENLGFEPPVDDTTIFELLDKKYPEKKSSPGSYFDNPDDKKQLNWKIYYHDAPLSVLCKYVYEHWYPMHLYGGNVFRFHEHFGTKTNFEYDIENGALPTYSFIEPAYTSLFYTANSNHPGGAIPDPLNANAQNFQPPIDVANGEKLLAEIYAILSRHQKVFERTLLIVTYDEHGGLYDHERPGEAVSPFKDPKSITNFKYDRYGVRVPAILINPRIDPTTKAFRPLDTKKIPGKCGSFETKLDHTSIIKTLCKQFNLGAAPTERAKKAPTLAGLVQPINTKTSDNVIASDVVAIGEASEKERQKTPPDLGKSLKLRNWFDQCNDDQFKGHSLNIAVISAFAKGWFSHTKRKAYPLYEIHDLDRVLEAKLSELNIANSQDLLNAISSNGISYIANHLGIDPHRVLRWEQEIDLLQVPGITGDEAYLLVSCNIDSVASLSKMAPGKMLQSINALIKRFGIDELLNQKEVNNWIDEAKKIIQE